MTEPTKRSFWKALISWKMLVMLALGFISGFPFYVVKDVLKAWMTDSNLDLGTIGLFSGVSLPYTWKFIWSPFMDRYVPPFLGRRRGWILISQIGLVGLIALLGQWDPATSLWWIAITALAVSFFSASQDIVLDAFRREYLQDEELGLGTAIWSNAWRLGMYVSVGVAFLSADSGIGWSQIHLFLAAMMVIGIVTTLLVPEPKVGVLPPRSLQEAVVAPFLDFFSRRGVFLILVFILFYKLGDNIASAMNIPFILRQGFTKTEYFVIVKGVGMLCFFGGALLGGAALVRMRISQALWIFGILQAVSTVGFSILVFYDHQSVFWADYRLMLLSVVVCFELLASGLGQSAYATYIAIQTNRKYTATQFALLTSLMAVPGTIGAMASGYMAQVYGWSFFYYVCALAAVPGLLVLLKIAPWSATNKELSEVE